MKRSFVVSDFGAGLEPYDSGRCSNAFADDAVPQLLK